MIVLSELEKPYDTDRLVLAFAERVIPVLLAVAPIAVAVALPGEAEKYRHSDGEIVGTFDVWAVNVLARPFVDLSSRPAPVGWIGIVEPDGIEWDGPLAWEGPLVAILRRAICPQDDPRNILDAPIG